MKRREKKNFFTQLDLLLLFFSSLVIQSISQAINQLTTTPKGIST